MKQKKEKSNKRMINKKQEERKARRAGDTKDRRGVRAGKEGRTGMVKGEHRCKVRETRLIIYLNNWTEDSLKD